MFNLQNLFNPFTHRFLDAKSQVIEALAPVIVNAVFAFLGVIPMILYGHWFDAFCTGIGIFLIIHIVYCLIINSGSIHVGPDRYLSPTMEQTVRPIAFAARFFIMLVTFIISFGVMLSQQ